MSLFFLKISITAVWEWSTCQVILMQQGGKVGWPLSTLLFVMDTDLLQSVVNIFLHPLA